MEKKISYSGVVIVLLAVAVVAMSIGFAAYSTSLNITGNTKVEANSWKVEFDPDTYAVTAGSTTETAEAVVNGTSVTYNTTLAKPGDYFEFTIKVKNLGTFDAKLISVTMPDDITAQHTNYLKYTVSYGSNQYTRTTNTSTNNLVLAAGSGEETVKVRVEYDVNVSDENLPSEAQNLTLTTTLGYEQA